MTTFEGFEHVPSLKVWSGIEGALAHEPKGRKRRAAVWFWAAAAAVILLLVSVVVLNQNEDALNGSMANSEVQSNPPTFQQPPARPGYPGGHRLSGSGNHGSTTTLVAHEDGDRKDGNQNMVDSQIANANGTRNAALNGSDAGSDWRHSGDLAARMKTEGKLAVGKLEMRLIPTLPVHNVWKPEPLTVASRRPFEPMTIRPQPTGRNGASFKMATAFNSTNSSTTKTFGSRSNSGVFMTSADAPESNLYGFIPEFNAPEFKTPIVYALAVSLPLNKRWSMESGLTYTQIASTSTGTHQATGAPQTLSTEIRYLGLPLVTRTHLLGKRQFSLASVQGLQIEKPLSATYEQSRLVANRGDVTRELNEGQTGMQGALIAGLDAEYKISKRIGLHLRPQASVYVVQHQNPYNLFVQRRVWPSIQTGIRFHLD